MIFTTEERRLFLLYRSGSAIETVDVVRDALAYITDRGEVEAALGLLRKLPDMSDAEFAGYEDMECGVYE